MFKPLWPVPIATSTKFLLDTYISVIEHQECFMNYLDLFSVNGKVGQMGQECYYLKL